MAEKFNVSKKEWECLWELGNSYAQPSSKDLATYFESGEEEIGKVLSVHSPAHFGIALDFGCGLGRLARALSFRFQKVYAVDISDTALNRASKLNDDRKNIFYCLNDRGDLNMFNNASIDFIYCARVFQHLPSKKSVADYVKEFIRVLAPDGLLCFQVPSQVRFMSRMAGNQVYEILKPILGQKLASRFLIRMLALKIEEINEILACTNGKLIDKIEGNSDWFGAPSYQCFVIRQCGEPIIQVKSIENEKNR